jgi:hypothetical protein
MGAVTHRLLFFNNHGWFGMLKAASLLLPLALATTGQPHASPHFEEIQAYVTGYNTVAAQTSKTPCTAASGANICGRRDAVACPRNIQLGTLVEIRGTMYICEDRLAKKYDTRFDISCDKDRSCPAQVTGWTTIKVYREDL